jgi:hypothetical protein
MFTLCSNNFFVVQFSTDDREPTLCYLTEKYVKIISSHGKNSYISTEYIYSAIMPYEKHD